MLADISLGQLSPRRSLQLFVESAIGYRRIKPLTCREFSFHCSSPIICSFLSVRLEFVSLLIHLCTLELRLLTTTSAMTSLPPVPLLRLLQHVVLNVGPP